MTEKSVIAKAKKDIKLNGSYVIPNPSNKNNELSKSETKMYKKEMAIARKLARKGILFIQQDDKWLTDFIFQDQYEEMDNLASLEKEQEKLSALIKQAADIQDKIATQSKRVSRVAEQEFLKTCQKKKLTAYSHPRKIKAVADKFGLSLKGAVTILRG